MKSRSVRGRWFGWCASLALIAFTTVVVAPAVADGQSQNFGAPFLLVPVGAQSVGQGEAVVADTTLGTESIWWNPAGLARLRKREIAVHDSRNAITTNDMIAVVFPSKVLGTLAAAGYIVNLGDQESTDSVNQTVGVITSRYYMLAASYGSPIGKQFSAGISAKWVVTSLSPQFTGNTSAFDIGGQYVAPTTFPITFGLAVRNIGPKLQVHDAPQADPLPRIEQAGVHITLPLDALAKNGAVVDAMSDVLVSSAYAKPVLSAGASVTYRRQLIVRGGLKSSNGNESSASVFSAGLGFRRGSIVFDLAREFDSASSGLGQPPTYVSLRYLF